MGGFQGLVVLLAGVTLVFDQRVVFGISDQLQGGDTCLKPVCSLALLLAVHRDYSVVDCGLHGVPSVNCALRWVTGQGLLEALDELGMLLGVQGPAGIYPWLAFHLGVVEPLWIDLHP